MPVKYICQKCAKRFVDWGAEKLKYRCPDCEDSELVRASEHEVPKPKKAKAKASLKRKSRKKAKAKPKADDSESESEPEVAEVTIGEDSTLALLLETGDDDGEGEDLVGLSITEKEPGAADDGDQE